MPGADVSLLRRYFAEEPWGSWRDNIHAAIIAREVRRLRMKRGARIDLKDFMFINPQKRGQSNVQAFVETLKAMAGFRRTSTPKKRPPSGTMKAPKVAARGKRKKG